MSNIDPTPQEQPETPLTPEQQVEALEADGFYLYLHAVFPDSDVDAPEFGSTHEDEILRKFFQATRDATRTATDIALAIEQLGFGENMVRIGPYVLPESLQEFADPSQLAPTHALYVHESVHPDHEFMRNLF